MWNDCTGVRLVRFDCKKWHKDRYLRNYQTKPKVFQYCY